MNEEMKIVLKKPIQGRKLLTGFKGVGGVGRLSLSYLLASAKEDEKAEKIGYITSSTQPPFVKVTESNIGTPYEFFEVGDLILLLIRFQPFLKEQMKLAKTITEKVAREEADTLILLGGLDKKIAEQVYEEEPLPITGVETGEALETSLLHQMEVPQAPQGIMISGGVALILSHASHLDLPALALFSPAEKGEVGRKSALRLSKKLSDFFDLDLNFEGIKEGIRVSKILEKQREKLEEQVSERREEISDLFT